MLPYQPTSTIGTHYLYYQHTEEVKIRKKQKKTKTTTTKNKTKECTEKKDLKKLLKRRTRAQLRVLQVKLGNYVKRMKCVTVQGIKHKNSSVLCLVWDCMRKMEILEEPGYCAPVLDGLTRTESLQTTVLQPNSALDISWSTSLKKKKKITQRKCFKRLGKGISTS